MPSFIRLASLFCVLGAVLSGCNFWDTGPDSARLLLEGTEGASVHVVTSTKFIAQSDQYIDAHTGLARDTVLVEFLKTDTLAVTLPFDKRYDISADNQIVIRVLRSSPETDDLVARMFVDGELKFAAKPLVRDDLVQFMYLFQKGRIRPKPET